MDFYLLNYWQDKNHISTVTSKIIDYKFNHDSVELLTGANQFSTVTYDKMQRRWTDLFSEFYTQYETPVEVITFPEILPGINKFNDAHSWENIMRILKEWCENTSEKYGLIIRNYDLKGHVNFSKINIDLNVKCHEKLLLFNPTQRVLLTIYFNEDAETLEQEVYSCINEVNVLSLLLREELIESDMTVSGIVVCSGIINHSNCIDCKNFIVSFDIFTSIEHFNSFWYSYIYQEIGKPATKGKEDSDSRNVFKRVASKILGFLAHFQFKTIGKAILPSLKKRPEEKIFETELLLNRYQMQIVYSKENHVFLTGSYGSGKTVVIYKKIELLQRNLKENDSIYYVNFEEKSHLDSDIKATMKLDEKVKVIKGGFNLSHIVKNRILPEEHRTGKIHLMVDEFDTQSLSEKETIELVNIFKNTPLFIRSTIFIAAQPIQISRTIFKTRKLPERIYTLKKFEKTMYSYNLKYVMRTTVEIYTLARITEKYLDGKSNHFIFESMNTTSIKKELPESSFDRPTSQNRVPYFPSEKRIDHDLLCKLAGEQTNRNDKQKWMIKTNYLYNLNSSIGHNIHGPLPKLIKISSSTDHLEQLALIAFFLSRIIEIDTKRIAIIHFEPKAPLWLKYLLQLTNFSTFKITSDATKFKNQDLDQDKQKEELVLLTDYRCVKGLEFPNVLLLLNEEEYYLKHFIPEAITRCMSNLSILLVSSYKRISHSETVSALVKKWEEVNHSDNNNPILETVELKFCDKAICETRNKEFCEVGGNKYVHKFANLFRDLYEEIRHNVVPNLKSDYEAGNGETASL